MSHSWGRCARSGQWAGARKTDIRAGTPRASVPGRCRLWTTAQTCWCPPSRLSKMQRPCTSRDFSAAMAAASVSNATLLRYIFPTAPLSGRAEDHWVPPPSSSSHPPQPPSPPSRLLLYTGPIHAGLRGRTGLLVLPREGGHDAVFQPRRLEVVRTTEQARDMQPEGPQLLLHARPQRH